MGDWLAARGPAGAGGGEVILRRWRPRSPRPEDRGTSWRWRTCTASSLPTVPTMRAAALAGEPDRSRLFAQSAAALEEAAGVVHHAAATGLGSAGRPLDAHAAGLEAAAARFELAADITRARRAR